MNRRTGLLIIFVVVLVFIAIFISPGLFAAGGPNLLAADSNNGSFEEGNYVNDPNEPIDNNSGCKALCGGSSSLDKWQVFNESLGANQSCDNAKDAVCWVQGSPDTPTTFQLYAQDGHRFLDLTGFARRTPKQYGEVQQSIGNIQPGQSYELSFWIGSSSRFPPPPTPPGKTPEVGVSVNVVGAISDNPSFDAPVTTEVSHWGCAASV